MRRTRFAKSIAVIAALCVLMTTLFVEPIFAGYEEEPQKYQIEDNGSITEVTGERRTAIDKMEAFSKSKWTIDEPVSYCYTSTDLTNTLEPGTYYGVPYTQLNREHSYLGKSEITLKYGDDRNVGGKLYRTLWGTDCSSSVDFAWRMATGKVNDSTFMKRKKDGGTYELYRTRHMFYDGLVGKKDDGAGDYLMLVGKYGNAYSERTSKTTTKEIIELLSADNNYTQGTPGVDVYNDIYSKVYAAIKPGDAILRKGKSPISGHVRLVVGVMIKYKNKTINGQTWMAVDPCQSKVLCIEQAGFRSGDPNWNTSWMPNTCAKTDTGKDMYSGIYTFAQLSGEDTSYNLKGDLIKTYYLPVKLKDWNE